MYKHNVKENLGLFYMCIAKSKTTSKEKFTKEACNWNTKNGMESQKYAQFKPQKSDKV